MSQASTLDSIYVPSPARIARIKTLTTLEKLLTVELAGGQLLEHQPGQFVMVSVPGIGEAPFTITSSPGRSQGQFELCVRKVGDVTTALHNLSEGAFIGVRGPFGNGFPIEKMHGKDVLFALEGLGLAAVRGLIHQVLDARGTFGRLVILYNAQTPGELLFKDELDTWGKRDDVELFVTVNRSDETWTGYVGAHFTLLPRITVNPRNTVAITVGRPVMYRLVLIELLGKGIPEGQIWLSLERHMKCGVGKCGHCQINHLYCCQHGPCFSYAQIKGAEEAI